MDPTIKQDLYVDEEDLVIIYWGILPSTIVIKNFVYWRVIVAIIRIVDKKRIYVKERGSHRVD